MDVISKYTDLFHDGSVTDIEHVGNKMVISMTSAELDAEDVKHGPALSRDSRLRGKLHVEEIKNIKINNKNYTEILTKKYDDGGIFNFEITNNFLALSIDWINFPPNPKIDEFATIIIEAKKIWWENQGSEN